MRNYEMIWMSPAVDSTFLEQQIDVIVYNYSHKGINYV